MIQCSTLRNYCYYELGAQDENFDYGVRKKSDIHLHETLCWQGIVTQEST